MAAKTGIERLTAREVQTARADVIDGGGLSIRVPRRGTGSPTWVFRFTSPDGRRREFGLGVVAQSSIAAAGQSLREAREAAARARALLREAIDPIEHAREQREQAKREVQSGHLPEGAVNRRGSIRLPLSRRAPRCVKHAQDLDRVASHPVRNDVSGFRDDQFAGSGDAARPAKRRMLG